MAAQQTHVSNLRQGTPFYAAPEVVQEGIFSRAADTYAYGIMMYELYSGRPVWVPNCGAPGGYSLHPGFPTLPQHCPAEYVALLADCLQVRVPGLCSRAGSGCEWGAGCCAQPRAPASLLLSSCLPAHQIGMCACACVRWARSRCRAHIPHHQADRSVLIMRHVKRMM